MTISRTRRTEEQRIADLEAKIVAIKAKAQRQKVKRDPALRHLNAAVRSIDKAVVGCEDAATRKALEEARSTLSACLSLKGVTIPTQAGPRTGMRRSAGRIDGDVLLEYVSKNPDHRGEQIAAALGTDTKSMRPVMKRLIDAKKVRTQGERRGMTYAATGIS